MPRRTRHRDSFKPAPLLAKPKVPSRSRVGEAAQLADALEDENTKLWLKRLMYCFMLSEKICLDLFRESLIAGEEDLQKQYIKTIEGKYAANKDPHYLYI